MERQNQRCVRFSRVLGEHVSQSTQTTQTAIPKRRDLQPTSSTTTRSIDGKQSHRRPVLASSMSSRKKISTTSTLSVPANVVVNVKKISRNEFKCSEWNKVYLDHPEIIKDKAKRLVNELEKKRIVLNESSIERIIRGEPKEYIQVIRKIFTAYESVLNFQNEKTGRDRNIKILLAKLEGRTSDGVAALFGILTHILDYKPALNPVQFMQNRYTIQKLILCNEIIRRLSNYRSPFQI